MYLKGDCQITDKEVIRPIRERRVLYPCSIFYLSDIPLTAANLLNKIFPYSACNYNAYKDDCQITDKNVIAPIFERRMLYPWSIFHLGDILLIAAVRNKSANGRHCIKIYTHTTTMLMYFDGELFAMSSVSVVRKNL
ncbi:hypothetical protein T12_4933 [Trichinella patagoniensis]|uniref:Uncharacterized protein n=1 Tax=Trichinella patagoniensis TaxID=990121 RepID=A0A0V0Z630_9BILA|nr:hypothetical protein T12_6548 [Trichinella patagoniensis]KRY18352.1 hypothetical protein T12_4933 [Trichinella patagoniensis]